MRWQGAKYKWEGSCGGGGGPSTVVKSRWEWNSPSRDGRVQVGAGNPSGVVRSK